MACAIPQARAALGAWGRQLAERMTDALFELPPACQEAFRQQRQRTSL
ncbi:hypothetical protein BRI6_0768 [plant metagenome]|uniref:Uncharacterized protein n=1 Tax=plant metagenome TaxID=1297885 RepID=A0A484TUE4_9ZZZZ